MNTVNQMISDLQCRLKADAVKDVGIIQAEEKFDHCVKKNRVQLSEYPWGFFFVVMLSLVVGVLTANNVTDLFGTSKTDTLSAGFNKKAYVTINRIPRESGIKKINKNNRRSLKLVEKQHVEVNEFDSLPSRTLTDEKNEMISQSKRGVEKIKRSENFFIIKKATRENVYKFIEKNF